jgi:hypothetical protein
LRAVEAPRDLVDEIAIAHAFGAADLVRCFAVERHAERSDQVLDDIVDGDRLGKLVEPVRRHDSW